MKYPLLLAVLVIARCSSRTDSKVENTALIEYQVRSSFPHDREAFTEGLVIHEGELYESTGQEGSSWIGIVDITTGKTKKKLELDDKYFGEGITILNQKVFQLTYKNKIGFIYDLQTFEKVGEFNYKTEGWGLTHNGESLIMSDGSSTLYFLDTLNQNITRKLNVTYNNRPVSQLNELEYVDGFIFANIWKTNQIAKIDVKTGVVVGFLDLSPLASQAKLLNVNVDVLNGIAWHRGSQLLLVTGKYWPFIYAIRLKESDKNI